MTDLVLTHLVEYFRQACSQFGEIDMAMGVDIHDGRYFTPSIQFAFYRATGRFANLRCKVRRCMFSALAVDEIFP